MIYRFFILIISILGILFAQKSSSDDVRLFQGFLMDAPITTVPYGEAGLQYSSYEYGSVFSIGVQGGYPVNPKIEIGGKLGFLNMSPEVGDSQSGLSDIGVYGRYNVLPGKTNISAGGYLTLPIGSEDVGQGNFDIGAFGALRHPLDNGMIITGVLGLNILDRAETETSILLGGGVIYPSSSQLSIIGELNLWTAIDYILLSGGVDYKLNSGGKIRGALGLGLDDGAPDLMFMGSYLMSF
jgi:hypothetical protein